MKKKIIIQTDEMIPVGLYYCMCCHEDIYYSQGEEAFWETEAYSYLWQLKLSIIAMWWRSTGDITLRDKVMYTWETIKAQAQVYD